MKFLHVSGCDDYGALKFQEIFNGLPVVDFIKEIDSYRQDIPIDEEITIKVHEYDTSPEFFDFVKNSIMDYDGSKHTNIYGEHETIKW